MPAITLKNVVLPAPFGPIRLTIEPSGIVKSIERTATSPPKRFVIARAFRIRPSDAVVAVPAVPAPAAVPGVAWAVTALSPWLPGWPRRRIRPARPWPHAARAAGGG